MRTIDAATLRARLDRGETPRLLDARRPTEYADGRIPGAVSLISDDVLERAPTVFPDREAEIVTYSAMLTCRRSTRAAERLESLGYTDVVEFPGGIDEWLAAGYDLER
jgi:rhodanese-related sulfurtransferase